MQGWLKFNLELTTLLLHMKRAFRSDLLYITVRFSKLIKKEYFQDLLGKRVTRS